MRGLRFGRPIDFWTTENLPGRILESDPGDIVEIYPQKFCLTREI
jgi:hypothetical protein